MTNNTKNYNDLLTQKLFSVETITDILLDMFKNSKDDPYLIVRDFFEIHAKKYGRHVAMQYKADYYAKSRLQYECDFDTMCIYSDIRDVAYDYLLEIQKKTIYKFDTSYYDRNAVSYDSDAKIKTIPVLSYHIVDGEEFYVLNIDEHSEEYTNLDKISSRLKAERVNSCVWDAGDSNLPPPKLDGIMWDEEY